MIMTCSMPSDVATLTLCSAELVSSAFDISVSRFGFFGVNYTNIVVIFHYTLLLFDLVCVKDEYQLTLLVSLIVAKPRSPISSFPK